MKEEIERCPFCDGGGLRVASIPDAWHVICVGCSARGPECEDKKQAIAAWSHRAATLEEPVSPNGENQSGSETTKDLANFIGEAGAGKIQT